MTDHRLLPFGSLSGGECDAASALAQFLALLAAVRRAARQRLRASAGDAPLDVAGGDAFGWLLVLAAAGGAFPLVAAAPRKTTVGQFCCGWTCLGLCALILHKLLKTTDADYEG